jgi:hypothetical protein
MRDGLVDHKEIAPPFPVASSYGGGIRPSTNDGSGMAMSNPEHLALERKYLRRSGPVPDILNSGSRTIYSRLVGKPEVGESGSESYPMSDDRRLVIAVSQVKQTIAG